MNKFFLIISFLVVSSCATIEEYEKLPPEARVIVEKYADRFDVLTEPIISGLPYFLRKRVRKLNGQAPRLKKNILFLESS